MKTGEISNVTSGENTGATHSLFEPHADIIVKGGREVQYGHKLNLTLAGAA
jgi:hypothetical protein